MGIFDLYKKKLLNKYERNIFYYFFIYIFIFMLFIKIKKYINFNIDIIHHHCLFSYYPIAYTKHSSQFKKK